jgi:hypothetical protein
MKRLRELATLTASEQRVIIAILTALLVFVAAKAYYGRSQDGRAIPVTTRDQPPSPSPGIGP